MFNLTDIKLAHSKVKSGSDFPKYIQDLKLMGVVYYEVNVEDGSVEYFGANNYKISAPPIYSHLKIHPKVDLHQFKTNLKNHQQGLTDYLTFCKDCAKSGIYKWEVDLINYTCIYLNQKLETVLIEEVPH